MVGAAAALVLVSGCGSSAHTKSKYIAQANAVCQTLTAKLNGIALGKEGHSLKRIVADVVRARADADAQLRAIPRPASDSVPLEWLRARQVALAAAERYSNARRRSAAAHAAAAAYTKARDQAEAIARSYGLSRCVGFAAS